MSIATNVQLAGVPHCDLSDLVRMRRIDRAPRIDAAVYARAAATVNERRRVTSVGTPKAPTAPPPACALTLEVTGADEAPNAAPALSGVRVDREVRVRIAHHAEILHRRSQPHKRHTALTEGTSEPTQCSRTAKICERAGDECTGARAARGGCVLGHEHAYRRALRHASLTLEVTGADEAPNAAPAPTGVRVHRIVRVRVLHHTEMLHRRSRPHKRHTALTEGTSEHTH